MSASGSLRCNNFPVENFHPLSSFHCFRVEVRLRRYVGGIVPVFVCTPGQQCGETRFFGLANMRGDVLDVQTNTTVVAQMDVPTACMASEE